MHALEALEDRFRSRARTRFGVRWPMPHTCRQPEHPDREAEIEERPQHRVGFGDVRHRPATERQDDRADDELARNDACGERQRLETTCPDHSESRGERHRTQRRQEREQYEFEADAHMWDYSWSPRVCAASLTVWKTRSSPRARGSRSTGHLDDGLTEVGESEVDACGAEACDELLEHLGARDVERVVGDRFENNGPWKRMARPDEVLDAVAHKRCVCVEQRRLEPQDEKIRHALVVGMAVDVAIGSWDARHGAEDAEVRSARVVDRQGAASPGRRLRALARRRSVSHQRVL